MGTALRSSWTEGSHGEPSRTKLESHVGLEGREECMNTEMISLSGFVLMFVLGLRHGLDPDHIACIDGLTWRALDQTKASTTRGAETNSPNQTGPTGRGNRDLAPWVGTLFAVGHGLLVTAIAVGVNQISSHVHVPNTAVVVFGWVPTVLLLFVGVLNLRQLLSGNKVYVPRGWKMKLLPRRLRENSSPFAVVAIGVLFATVFDTATQASAWGYVATSSGGMLAAAGAGLIFTAGMVITDTLDGRLLCHVVRRSDGELVGQRYRRALGWLIVTLSFGVAGYNIAKEFVPGIELDELAYSTVGGALLALVALLWIWLNRSRLGRVIK